MTSAVNVAAVALDDGQADAVDGDRVAVPASVVTSGPRTVSRSGVALVLERLDDVPSSSTMPVNISGSSFREVMVMPHVGAAGAERSSRRHVEAQRVGDGRDAQVADDGRPGAEQDGAT